MRSRKDSDYGTWIVALLVLIFCYLLANPQEKPDDSLRASTSAASRLGDAPTYQLSNIRVVDADTIQADIHLPYATSPIELPYNTTLASSQGVVKLTKERIRIAGINAYERSTPRGLEASQVLEELMPLAISVLLQDTGGVGGRDKYGRILGDVILVFDPPGTTLRTHLYSGELKISEWVLDNNYGVRYAP